MTKFAKLFDLDEENQLLLTIRYTNAGEENCEEEGYVVSFETAMYTFILDAQFKYSTEKSAREMFDSIGYNEALILCRKLLDFYGYDIKEAL